MTKEQLERVIFEYALTLNPNEGSLRRTQMRFFARRMANLIHVRLVIHQDPKSRVDSEDGGCTTDTTPSRMNWDETEDWDLQC